MFQPCSFDLPPKISFAGPLGSAPQRPPPPSFPPPASLEAPSSRRHQPMARLPTVALPTQPPRLPLAAHHIGRISIWHRRIRSSVSMRYHSSLLRALLRTCRRPQSITHLNPHSLFTLFASIFVDFRRTTKMTSPTRLMLV